MPMKGDTPPGRSTLTAVRRAMPFLHGLALFIVIASFVSTADASTVTITTRPANNGGYQSSANDYRSAWLDSMTAYPTAPGGYCDTTAVPVWDNTASNQGCGGGATDISFHYQVDFFVKPAGGMDFQIAPDFGYGGAAFLDGAEVGYDSGFNTYGGMWWGGDWNNTSQMFVFSSNLAAGLHTLDVYGQEGCCDGPTGGRFSRDGGSSWTAFGDNDGLNAVPEPSSILLSATGLVGLLGYVRRRKGQI